MTSDERSLSTRRDFLVGTMAAGSLKAMNISNPAALAAFGADAQAELQSLLNDRGFRGRLPSSTVAALQKADGLTRDALMLKLIPVAKSFAHPPLSNYFVGAVALGASGSLYLGCNVEIPGNMLGLAMHAEQAAIANAYMSDEHNVEALTVGGAPCGHCRQFLSEVSLETPMRLIMKDGSSLSLSELLPIPFGPKNLGLKDGSFPVRHNSVSLLARSTDELELEAYKAASRAYSPYSRSPSGVALLTDTGRIFAGSYIENAAFNPSLPPLEAALAGYFLAGSESGSIQKAVLAEAERAGISHQSATQSALAALAPGVMLKRVLLKV